MGTAGLADARRRCSHRRAPPPPALARDSFRPVSAYEPSAGAQGAEPGARDKPEAGTVAA